MVKVVVVVVVVGQKKRIGKIQSPNQQKKMERFVEQQLSLYCNPRNVVILHRKKDFCNTIDWKELINEKQNNQSMPAKVFVSCTCLT
jgi:hypothetical protein